MSVLFVALPVALGLAAVAVAAFVNSVRGGQFDDLDTPPIRMLFDDPPATYRSRTPTSRHDEAGRRNR